MLIRLGRRSVISFLAVGLSCIVVAVVFFAARESQLAKISRLQQISGYITPHMIAENPKKYLGRRVRLRCRIETFIDGPVEGPAAYASCPPARDNGTGYVERFVLRGDQFGDLDVDDMLTVTGTVNVTRTETVMGDQTSLSAIDVDRVELLTKGAGPRELP